MLSSKHHLKSLDLEFISKLGVNLEIQSNISEEEHERIEEVLGNLCPPTCIELLHIRGYFARGLPQGMRRMADFESLRWLDLNDYACCPQLPNRLGQLPGLDFLWIGRAPSVQSVGHDFLLPCPRGEGDAKGKAAGQRIAKRRPQHGIGVAFPRLRTLGFVVMPRWRVWEWEDQLLRMPVLDSLTVRNCKLHRLPRGLATCTTVAASGPESCTLYV